MKSNPMQPKAHDGSRGLVEHTITNSNAEKMPEWELLKGFFHQKGEDQLWLF